jgi:hypothetical protein
LRPFLTVLALLLLQPWALCADPAAAERQYRIARRLVVEQSPEAKAALEKVLELDPQGKLADDALVDQALLLGIPRWPEEVGSLDAVAAAQARQLLKRVTDEFSLSDRASEARYRKALLRLEPLPSHDASDARLELVTVATIPDQDSWSRSARFALGWLAEQQVNGARAIQAYQRLVVDAPHSEAAGRARLGRARLLMGEGRFGEAARWLEGATDPRAEAMLTRVLRTLMALEGGALVAGGASGAEWATDVSSLVSFAVTPDGGVLFADTKSKKVTRLGADGRPLYEWQLEDVHQIAVSPFGLAFAAAADGIFLLRETEEPRRVAELGEFAPLSSLAVDGLGRFWLLDRKGEKIGRIQPGGMAPSLFLQMERGKLQDLAWDGRRLVALESRERNVVAIDGEGGMQKVTVEPLQKPLALAVGPAGHLALLEGKLDAVLFLDATGGALGSISWEWAGVQKPVAIGLGVDGSVTIFDDAGHRCVRLP